MTQKTEPVSRDAVILLVVVVAGASLGFHGTRQMVSEQWQVVGFAAGGFSAQWLIKLAMPRHSILRLFSWPSMLIIQTAVVGAVVLMSDRSLLGAWTLPALIGLVLLGWIVGPILGPRKRDPEARPATAEDEE